jgi:CO/xanthine dehydrogenase Mo-binding subunit
MSTPAAIANAIADALSVTEVILPATPRRIYALMRAQPKFFLPPCGGG